MGIDDKRAISELPIKPRRTKGTVSFRVRNYYAAAVLSVAAIIGFGWTFLDSTRKIREFAESTVLVQSDDYRNKKFVMKPFGPGRTSRDIEKFLEELDGTQDLERAKANQEEAKKQA